MAVWTGDRSRAGNEREEAAGGGSVLRGVRVRGRLHDLLAEVEVEQTYRNDESVAIEAVYSFPVPSDAVLLGLEVRIGDRRLHGRVMARNAAEERYEDAVVEGDSAILLQQAEPGLYTINVGNLQPGETAVLAYRFARLQRWQGDFLRFHLPTVVAPRYGDAGAFLEPHQVPGTDLAASHAWQFEFTLTGLLANARIECPTHEVDLQRREGETTVRSLPGRAWLDRDLVLEVRPALAAPASAVWDRDGAGYVALASFQPEVPGEGDPGPLCLKLVVDCSGSMAGESVAQARQAAAEILGLLRPEDSFTLTAFGSHHRFFKPESLPATPANVEAARRFVLGLDGDMGGTEMGAALSATYRLPIPAEAEAAVLLVTDGEVWQHEAIVREAQASGHRVFAVGVGSAVSEAFLGALAERTGGGAEYVTPNEAMAERIVRHFRRIATPRAAATVAWDGQPVRVFPESVTSVFHGDTLHLLAWFDAPPTGACRLRVETPTGTTTREAHLQPMPSTGSWEAAEAAGEQGHGTLARIAAWKNLPALPDATERARQAEAYQLLTDLTALVAVDVRAADEKAQGLPELRKVPQMLAAGWGGTGKVARPEACYSRIGPDVAVASKRVVPSAERSVPCLEPESWVGGAGRGRKPGRMTPEAFAAVWCREARDAGGVEGLLTIRKLVELGLPEARAEWLRDLVDVGAGVTEAFVVALFLAKLFSGPLKRVTERHCVRQVRLWVRDEGRPALTNILAESIGQLLDGTTATSW